MASAREPVEPLTRLQATTAIQDGKCLRYSDPSLAVGRHVIRLLYTPHCFGVLTVTNISQDRIQCGPWDFCLFTGKEIDEDDGWDSSDSGAHLL